MPGEDYLVFSFLILVAYLACLSLSNEMNRAKWLDCFDICFSNNLPYKNMALDLIYLSFNYRILRRQY